MPLQHVDGLAALRPDVPVSVWGDHLGRIRPYYSLHRLHRITSDPIDVRQSVWPDHVAYASMLSIC